MYSIILTHFLQQQCVRNTYGSERTVQREIAERRRLGNTTCNNHCIASTNQKKQRSIEKLSFSSWSTTLVEMLQNRVCSGVPPQAWPFVSVLPAGKSLELAFRCAGVVLSCVFPPPACLQRRHEFLVQHQPALDAPCTTGRCTATADTHSSALHSSTKQA